MTSGALFPYDRPMTTPPTTPKAGERPRGFFPMPRADIAFLVIILAWAIVALLPWARETEAGGVAMLGWLMAGLMVLSPAIALGRILMARRRRRRAHEDRA